MRSEEEIRETIELAENRANMYYKHGNFVQYNQWLNFVDGLKWVLDEEQE